MVALGLAFITKTISSDCFYAGQSLNARPGPQPFQKNQKKKKEKYGTPTAAMASWQLG